MLWNKGVGAAVMKIMRSVKDRGGFIFEIILEYDIYYGFHPHKFVKVTLIYYKKKKIIEKKEN